MADTDSAASSELSDVPSMPESEHGAALPAKRRKTGGGGGGGGGGDPSSLSHSIVSAFDRANSFQPGAEQEDDHDHVSLSEDGFSSAPQSPSHDEFSLRQEAQTECLWRDCPFGAAQNNDLLVQHVQTTHCATGGPKKARYVCEWGECQKKTSNHPSGYALKAHMRSHTKEKPYYCALPECDRAFTRSDALAKHMRTVHEPEQSKTMAAVEALPSISKSGKGPKLKMSNLPIKSEPAVADGPTHDEAGNPITPSPANDNITYIPAHHPITGHPGFMIHYPPDTQFTAWESSIPANILAKVLRRQLNEGNKEAVLLRKEVSMLEKAKKDEWVLKEILLDGVMEAEMARGERDGLLAQVDSQVRKAMESDVAPARQLQWAPRTPAWRRPRVERSVPSISSYMAGIDDTAMQDRSSPVLTPLRPSECTPSPPLTGRSGGFEGEADPYDNYVDGQEAHFAKLRAQRGVERSDVNTPRQKRDEAKGREERRTPPGMDYMVGESGHMKKDEAGKEAEGLREVRQEVAAKEADAAAGLMGMSGDGGTG